MYKVNRINKMAVRTITNTVPSLTKEQAIQHLEVYGLAVNALHAFNSNYLRLNNRRYGGRNKTTKASLQESLSYYKGQLHAYQTILHMVNENVKAPMVNMANFTYNKDVDYWYLAEGTDELIDFRHESYSESILKNVK
jgi:hypothetical protein